MRWVRACTVAVVAFGWVSSACAVLEGLDQYSETTCTEGCGEAGDGPTVMGVLHDGASEDHRVQTVSPDSEAASGVDVVVAPDVVEASAEASDDADAGADVGDASATGDDGGDAS